MSFKRLTFILIIYYLIIELQLYNLIIYYLTIQKFLIVLLVWQAKQGTLFLDNLLAYNRLCITFARNNNYYLIQTNI